MDLKYRQHVTRKFLMYFEPYKCALRHAKKTMKQFTTRDEGTTVVLYSYLRVEILLF